MVLRCQNNRLLKIFDRSGPISLFGIDIPPSILNLGLMGIFSQSLRKYCLGFLELSLIEQLLSLNESRRRMNRTTILGIHTRTTKRTPNKDKK